MPVGDLEGIAVKIGNPWFRDGVADVAPLFRDAVETDAEVSDLDDQQSAYWMGADMVARDSGTVVSIAAGIARNYSLSQTFSQFE